MKTYGENPRNSSNPLRTPPALRNGMPGDVIDQYPYTDAEGHLLFEVVRKREKDFRQWSLLPDHPEAGKRGCPEGFVWGRKKHGINPVLYRLPDVLRAPDRGKKVFVVEGEKDQW